MALPKAKLMWFLKWIAIGIALFVGISKIALGDTLDSWTTWSTAQPYVSKQVSPAVMVMRGSGTDAYYVVEVDPTTGQIPVDATVTIAPGSDVDVTNLPATVDVNFGTPGASTLRSASMLGVGSTAVSNANPVPISDAGGIITVDGTVAATQSGAWTVAATQSGTWTMQPGNTANTTPWLATVSQGGNSATVSAGGALKVDASASTQPVSGTVAVSNLPATVAVNAGAVDSSTLRVAQGGESYSDSARYDYTGGSVTTGAWTQVDASTAAAINQICITDQSGQIMELGSGALSSETRIFLIPRGFSGCIPLRIAASTRLSLKAVSATASTGDFVYTGLQ